MIVPALRSFVRFMTLTAMAALLSPSSYCQTASSANRVQPAPAPPPQQESKRIFGILPNNRTSPMLGTFKPISTKEKFTIAAKDSFDWGAVLLAGVAAGVGQLNNSNPSFGQGAAGYGRYFGTAYCDVVTGNMMTVAIYPSMLRQDPRYFRKGTGSTWSRLGYAMSRIFVTFGDSGHRQFNYSEILGNATSAGISNAYYPDNRTLGDNFSRFGIQVGLDMAGNILKEFAPNGHRKQSPQLKAPATIGPNGAKP
jgi:hypothetical protein